MLKTSKLRQRPRHFHRLVGLSVSEFDVLLEAVREVYPAHQAHRLSQRERKRQVGGGRGFALGLEERLLATLLFYRLHLTGILLSCLFDLDESNLWRERHWRMLPVLQDVLPTPMQDHLLSSLEKPSQGGGGGGGGKARKRISTLQELLEAYPELRDLCVDATEQEVPKPQNKEDKKQRFSGKSHCHTVKTQVVTAGRLVLHHYGNCPGSVADCQVLKASGVMRAVSGAASPVKTRVQSGQRPAFLTLRHRRRVRLDRGYGGMDTLYQDLPQLQMLVAIKGGGKQKITALGKAWNRAMVSPLRMQVEQNLGHLQNWRVLSGRYRADFSSHWQTFSLVAGLHNFTILGRLNWEK